MKIKTKVKAGRITNVRANAAGVPSGLGGVGQLQANISISGGGDNG
jgi:hypothetical protein